MEIDLEAALATGGRSTSCASALASQWISDTVLRVLFVDDERLLLDAMRNRMRRQRSVWSMRFVESGSAALEALAQEDADVVVTDSRMPGMEGPELLSVLRKQHPNALRILLSGAAEQGAVVEGLRVAHQYLCKPCNGDQLVSVVDRLRSMQDTFSNAAMQRVIHSVDALPMATAVQTELSRELSSPNADLKKIAAIAERDPALSLRLLRLANSAYQGGVQAVTQVSVAVSRLGLAVVHGLVASSQVLNAVESTLGEHKPLVELMQQRGLEVAKSAARLLKGEEASRAYLTGLLHDVGGLVMLAALPDQRTELFKGSPWACQRFELERKLLGFTHAEVGAYLLGTWGLPQPLVDAVARQHCPQSVPGTLDAAGAVHIAQRLVMEQQSQARGAAIRAEFDWQYISAGGHNLKALAQQALT